ncbi:MAG TPA: P22 phage major capsid protein family protein [Acetobacteraceae bacterium]|jgi:hypothetical protein|nr:P22 phage major capsid protein family protein [Acetobacteraceae bacterium]
MATNATNTLITPNMLTAKTLAILHQKLNFVGSINKEYDDSFAQSGAKIGQSLRIRIPNQYTIRQNTMTLSPQNTVEQNVTLTVSNVSGVDMAFNTTDLTMSMDRFTERYIEPAAAIIAADIESRSILSFNQVYNQINGQGAAQTFKNVLTSRKLLLDNLAPQSKQWQLRINTQDNVDMVDSLKGLFQSSQKIASQYTDGVMGYTAGFEWAENTHLSQYTRGAGTGAYTVNSLATNQLVVQVGTGASSIGDVFTVAGVFRVHPETKASTGVLQQFVNLSTNAGGAATWTISPTPVASGALQNVSVLPANGNAITFAGTASTASGISLAYHPDFATFASADLEMPRGVDMASRAQQDGISIRLVRQYDINNDFLPTRLDVLWGISVIRPQLAVRLAAN